MGKTNRARSLRVKPRKRLSVAVRNFMALHSLRAFSHYHANAHPASVGWYDVEKMIHDNTWTSVAQIHRDQPSGDIIRDIKEGLELLGYE